MTQPLERRVCSVVADVFGLPLNEVTSDTSHEQVENWDSLNIINLLLALEDEFGVDISPDEAVGFLSVANVLSVLREKEVSPV